MKKFVLTLSILLVISFTSFAQSPKAFKYQAVARNVNGDVLINKSVSFKVSILKGSTSGTIMYSETHNPATNGFGLVNLDIGSGALVSGNFSAIDWGIDKYFIRIELDAQGGTNYQVMGTSQLLSVPYALYAERAGNDYDADSTNELQVLSISNDTLYLQNGGFVHLGTYLDNTDNQILSLNDDTLHITNGNFVNLVFNDNDSTNELQALSISNDTIFLANGGFVKLPAVQTGSVPANTCLNSTSITPPFGYTYSGDYFSGEGKWTVKANMPTARYGLTLNEVNNKIYAFGGMNSSGGVLNNNEEFDPALNAWTSKTSMPTARSHIASAVVNNKIYVIGGHVLTGTGQVSTNEVYNPATNTWSTKANMITARKSMSAETVNGKIYVIGGGFDLSTNATFTTNEEYNPVTNTWSTKANIPTRRYSYASAVYDDKIFVIGGGSNSTAVKVNEVYDPATNTWSTKASMPTTRNGCSGGILNDNIYVLGGKVGTTFYSSNEMYDPINNTWTSIINMPTARSHFAFEAVNNKIYVLGGGDLINVFNKNEEYTPPKTYYMHCKN